MTYQFKPLKVSLLAYNPLVLSSAYTTGGGTIEADQGSQAPETNAVVLLANGKELPDVGKIFYVGDSDIFFYQERQLSTKIEDAYGNPLIAYAKDNAEVGSFTGNYYTLRGRLHSVEVITTRKILTDGYYKGKFEKINAWVGTHIIYQGGKGIETIPPVWATAQNQGQIWSGNNAPATDTPATDTTEKKSNRNIFLIIGAFLIYIFTKKKKK